MPKLTLLFKQRLLRVYHLDEGSLTIGREPDCTIRIDSLAIAPRHAEFVTSDTAMRVRALDTGYPVLLNNKAIEEAALRHGDIVGVGKHVLLYSADEQALNRSEPVAVEHSVPEADENLDPMLDLQAMPAYVQIQSGKRMGRLIAFDRQATPLGHQDAVVERHGKDYRIKRLSGECKVRVDGSSVRVGSSVKLVNENKITVGTEQFQFFQSDTAE